MREITNHTRDRLVAWWDHARKTPHVRRFMAAEPYRGEVAELNGTWDGVRMLSNDGSVLVSLALDRGSGDKAGLSAWCLHPERVRRAYAVGRALLCVPAVLAANGVRVLRSAVHETNVESLALNRRRMGKPWGIEPAAAWDAGEGRFVDLHHFQRVLKD